MLQKLLYSLDFYGILLQQIRSSYTLCPAYTHIATTPEQFYWTIEKYIEQAAPVKYGMHSQTPCLALQRPRPEHSTFSCVPLTSSDTVQPLPKGILCISLALVGGRISSVKFLFRATSICFSLVMVSTTYSPSL